MKETNTTMVVGAISSWLWDLKVVPTVQATGILCITTLTARTVIVPISLNIPIARPSIRLCKQIASPKPINDWVDILWSSLTYEDIFLSEFSIFLSEDSIVAASLSA